MPKCGRGRRTPGSFDTGSHSALSDDTPDVAADCNALRLSPDADLFKSDHWSASVESTSSLALLVGSLIGGLIIVF